MALHFKIALKQRLLVTQKWPISFVLDLLS